MRFTESDKENLREMIGSEGLESIFRLLESLVKNMEKDVLNCDLATDSFAALGIRKTKLDGARLLLNRARKQITELKGER